MSGALTLAEAEALLFREAQLIDSRQYDEWLALFEPDVEFWVPAWRSETVITSDPDRELSLIYYKGRRNLEDRVARLTSGLSTASSPPPRVVHAISNVMLAASSDGEPADEAQVRAVFVCHRFDVRMSRQDCFFGRYEYVLRSNSGTWKIARKKVVLLNDTIPTVVDIDSI